ncbi:ABC transporter substrate-binding protein [Acetivibrio saccincola]|jgi:iron complex transport system substrate-binding protein|uniref:ABC transporter substrate-binding protein n=1 Tax=Acetivibrio saccincola TaxID=1677857 RepID=UPI001693DDF2|nr:ABC transporter substrate-binding protein [Acetivibrio saccincola]NLW27619.1 ABC transporter substrate-binding protein [Acetivibrio saccincola]
MKCKIKWKRKPVLLILIVIFTIVFAAGCEADEKIPESLHDSAVTITDMMGREITLEEPVTKVIAMTPSDCEILYAIGAGEALVGRGEYCDYPPEVLELPKVCTGENTNLEEIISLKPQVVLMGTMGQTKEQVAALERAGIKVVVSQATDIEGVYSSVDMIGKLMNREEEAQNVINSMKKTFDEVSQKKVQMKGKTVYFEVSPLEYGLWTAGSGTFMNEIAEIIGLENCFADVEGWGEISEEQVLERNPDYIVTIAMYFGEGPTPEEEIAGRKGWENITAVKNRAILNLQNDELSRPVPRLAEGAKMLYDFVTSITESEESGEH